MLLVPVLPLFAALARIVGLADDSARNIVDLGYVKYKGNLTYPNTAAYLGVPYAEPPLGDLRWRAPLALNTSRITDEAGGKVVDLTEYPDFCIQGSTGSGEAGGAGSEDCLKINIYAPAGAKKGDNLPVLVYIHGGGYAYGNPANWRFDHWIHQSPNVIIASVYYRLNSIGFLATPELTQEGLGDLNSGFLDQTMALRWIQEHIYAFGGDPNKVTINGESAGASSIELHLVSSDRKGLFNQAILQSVFRTPLPTPEQQKPMFQYYAEQAGCGSGPVSHQMMCLRKADVSALSRAQDFVFYNFTGSYDLFRPVIDNKLFLEYPSISIMKGDFADVPIVVGSCSNETLSGGANIAAALKMYFPALTDTDLQQYLAEYPLSDFESAAQQFQVATGESDIICARHIIGLASAKRTAKTYTYRYNQPIGNSTTVGHAAENWIMFRGTSTGFNGTTTFQPQTPLDMAFASELIAYWLSFVRAGDPNAHKLSRSPDWPSYTTSDQQRLVLQEPKNTEDTSVSGSYSEKEPALESSRCDFVASKAQRQQA